MLRCILALTRGHSTRRPRVEARPARRPMLGPPPDPGTTAATTQWSESPTAHSHIPIAVSTCCRPFEQPCVSVQPVCTGVRGSLTSDHPQPHTAGVDVQGMKPGQEGAFGAVLSTVE